MPEENLSHMIAFAHMIELTPTGTPFRQGRFSASTEATWADGVLLIVTYRKPGTRPAAARKHLVDLNMRTCTEGIINALQRAAAQRGKNFIAGGNAQLVNDMLHTLFQTDADQLQTVRDLAQKQTTDD